MKNARGAYLPTTSEKQTGKSVPDSETIFSRQEITPLLLTLVAGVVCYGLFIGRGVGLSVLGYNESAAERLLYGEAPYRDFFYNYTPGTLWVNALLLKGFGVSLMAIRAGLFVFKVATLLALFWAARRLTSARAALIPVALTLGWIGWNYVYRVYPTQYSMLFILAALLCMLNFDRAGRARWLLLCGMAIGMVFLFKHNVGILLLLAAAAALAVRDFSLSASPLRSPGWVLSAARKAAVCLLGVAVPVGAMLAYLAYQGALGAMLDHFITHAAAYSGEKAIALPPARQVLPAAIALIALGAAGAVIFLKAARFFEPFVILAMACGLLALLIPGRAFILKNSATAALAYLLPLLLVAALGVSAWRFKRNRGDGGGDRAWWRREGPTVMVALFALGAFMEMYPRADYSHLVRVLPPVFLLLLLLLARALPALTSSWQSRFAAPRRVALWCAATPLLLLLATGVKDTWQRHFDSRLQFAERAPLTIERAEGIRVGRKQARFIEGIVGIVEARTAPGDYIFSFGQRESAFYFLSGRRNPTRFVWWTSVGIPEAERAAALEVIANRVPRLILLPEKLRDQHARDCVAAWYHQIATVDGVAIYESNP